MVIAQKKQASEPRRMGQKEEWTRKRNPVSWVHLRHAHWGTVLAAWHMPSWDRSQSCECAASVTLLISVLYGQQHRSTRRSAKTVAPAAGWGWRMLTRPWTQRDESHSLVITTLCSNQTLSLQHCDSGPMPRKHGTLKGSCHALSGDVLSHVQEPVCLAQKNLLQDHKL